MSKTPSIVIPLSESEAFREIALLKRFEDRPDIVLEVKKHPMPVAQFAIELLMRGGILSATEGGEDSSGRARMRHETPEEVVNRALQIADLTFKGLEERGWLHITSGLAGAMDICDVARKLEESK